LDRDGVLNENRPDYVCSLDQLKVYEQAVSALASIHSTPYRIIVITNQSGIGRGLFTLETAEAINRKLMDAVEAGGGRLDEVYTCPHGPDSGCRCRKPLPGMILEAAEKHSIDLEKSILIGDAVSDLEAGMAAGIPNLALVRTGRGREQEKLIADLGLQPRVFDDLAAALESLIPG